MSLLYFAIFRHRGCSQGVALLTFCEIPAVCLEAAVALCVLWRGLFHRKIWVANSDYAGRGVRVSYSTQRWAKGCVKSCGNRDMCCWLFKDLLRQLGKAINLVESLREARFVHLAAINRAFFCASLLVERRRSRKNVFLSPFADCYLMKAARQPLFVFGLAVKKGPSNADKNRKLNKVELDLASLSVIGLECGQVKRVRSQEIFYIFFFNIFHIVIKDLKVNYSQLELSVD